MLINALQARGAATESLIVNISRQGLIYIPAMFILGAIFHETGLIWAQPVADVLSLLLAIGLYLHTSRKTDFGSWDGDPSAARISFYWNEPNLDFFKEFFRPAFRDKKSPYHITRM